jgi:trigger factor
MRKDPSTLATLRAPIFEEKVVDFLLELASVTDKPVTREALYRDDEHDHHHHDHDHDHDHAHDHDHHHGHHHDDESSAKKGVKKGARKTKKA